MTRRQAVGWLVVVCLVWGVSFTVVKAALDSVSPLVLLGIRLSIAASLVAMSLRGSRREDLAGGLLLGLLFGGGFAFQTIGLRFTTPSRSAFITILSTPLVPVVQYLVHRTLPRVPTLAAVGLALAGTYLLTSPGGGLGLNRGDLLTLGCAVLFAGQIVAAGYYVTRMPISRLLALQLGVGALLASFAAPVLEAPRIAPGGPLIAMLLFLALSGLWSFHMQLRAQQILSPTHTALVFTLEPVFAALTSFLVLGERLGLAQLAGAALILVAVAAPALERPSPRPAPTLSG